MNLLATLNYIGHGGNLRPTEPLEYHSRGIRLAEQITTFEFDSDGQHSKGTDGCLASLKEDINQD